MMNKRLIPLVIAGILVLLLFAVVLSAALSSPDPASRPTIPAQGSLQTLTVSGQAAQTPQAVGPLPTIDPGSPSQGGSKRTFPPPPPVYTPVPVEWVEIVSDDFTDSSLTELPTIRQPGITAKYYDGAYQIFVVAPGKMGFVSHTIDSSNTRLQVDAMMTAGSKMNYYGLLCRFSDRNNFYYFAVSSAGAFAVGKVVDGVKTSLLPDEFLPAEVVNRELDEVNRLDVICDGPHLYLSVNGELLASVVDHDLVNGDRFGLLASAAEEGGVSIYFDDLMLYKVP